MLRNYLLLTLRNLRRRRLYAAINLMGLTLGLCSILLVILYVDYESSYDQHFDRSEDIYRLEHHFRTSWYSTLGFNNYFDATVAEQWAYPISLEEIAEVEVAAQVIQKDNVYFEVGQKRFVENQLLLTITGKRLLDVFSLEWIEGDPASAFDQPNQVILTDRLAQKYFGTANPIGEIIEYDSIELRVSGVISSLPPNSHFHPSMIIQLKRLPHWGAHTYLRLKPNTNPQQVAAQVVPPSERYQTSELFKGVRLTPLHDLHFAEPTKYNFEWPGDPQYLYIFLWIGCLILLITITNYINLSIAFYSHRNREIGIRKVSGAQRGQIAFQFLFEAWLLTLFSLPLAIGLLELLMPRFNELMGVELWSGRLWQWKPLGIMVLVWLGTGLLAGSYPAWYLSRQTAIRLFRPLRGERQPIFSLRRGLVLFQFVLLIFMGSASWLVQNQMDYLSTKNLGFDAEGVIHLPQIDGVEAYQELKQSLSAEPSILGVGAGAPPGSNSNKLTYKLEGSEEIFDDAIERWADHDFFKVLKIDLPILDDHELPDQVYLVNEAATRRLGIAGQAFGKTVIHEPEELGDDSRHVIQGVLPDFHYYSLHEQINPQLFTVLKKPTWVYAAVIRVQLGQTLPQTLDKIQMAYEAAMPETPFRYTFLGDELALNYLEETRMATLGKILTSLAVFLAMVGLLGLTAFMAYLRSKEIGIRRILGASVGQILVLLNREFMYLLILAVLVGIPLTWWFVENWLQSFAYRVGIEYGIFVSVSGLSAILIFVVVSWHAWRTAHQNPAQVLRNE